jgi:hypothetical protein
MSYLAPSYCYPEGSYGQCPARIGGNNPGLPIEPPIQE